MINLLTSASRFLNDTENFNSTTDKLLSSLFDGFIFYLAVVVFIITVPNTEKIPRSARENRLLQ